MCTTPKRTRAPASYARRGPSLPEAHVRDSDGSQGPAAGADGTLRYVDVNEDDKREAIAMAFGSPTAAAQATCKQNVERKGGTG